MEVLYTPGPRLVVVGEVAIAVLDPAVSAEMLKTIWGTVNKGGGVGEILQAITAAYGTNLNAIPPFAVIAPADDGVRLAVRGPLVVRVHDRAGTETVSGVGVTTWSERWLTDPVSVEVLDASAAELSLEPSAAELPIRLGVVKAESVRVVVRAADPEADPGPRVLGSPASAPDAEPTPFEQSPPAEPTTYEQGPLPEPTTYGLAPAPEPIDPEVTVIEAQEPCLPAEPAEAAASQTPAGSAAETPVQNFQRLDETATEAGQDSYDHLWGPTVLRRVEDAAVREAEETEDVTPDPFASLPLIALVPGFDALGGKPVESNSGDHDGETIMNSQLAQIRAQAGKGPNPASIPPGVPVPSGQTVLARMCDKGHPSPPQSAQCRVCGLDLHGEAYRVSRPTLGRIVLSNGSVVDLDRPVVVGRKPRVSRVQGADLPRLITVPSPQQDISRSHLEVRIEEWHVLVVDLGTTNGTILQRPGQPHRRLQPNETVMVRSEDVVDIGDGVTMTFESIP